MINFNDLQDYVKKTAEIRKTFGFISAVPYRNGAENDVALITPPEFVHFVDDLQAVEVYRYAVGSKYNYICYYEIMKDFRIAVAFYGMGAYFAPIKELEAMK